MGDDPKARRYIQQKKSLTGLLCSLSLGFASAANASYWELDVLGGAPYNFDSDITFKQTGQADHTISGDYRTEPFTPPLYYAIRLRKPFESVFGELEFVHHKVYLNNSDSIVQRFAASHGLNLFTVNISVSRDHFGARAGVGGILAHPESEVRNQPFDESGGLFSQGLFWSGPVAQIGAEYRYPIAKRLAVITEIKYSLAYADVKISNGSATFWQSSLHGLGGVSFQW